MTMSVVFELKKSEVDMLEEQIKKIPERAEYAINKYIHSRGKDILSESIEQYTPVSDRDKKHAKGSNPYKTVNGNLSVTIKSKKSFRYLYFPNAGAGTSKLNPKNEEFMQDGVDSVHNRVVNELLEEIKKEIK